MLDFLVQLDPRLQQLIALGVTFVVALAINYLTTAAPWLAEYLGQHRVAVITWLTGIIVQIIQSQLDKIPATWDSVLLLVMQLIVEVSVVLIGFAYLAKKKGVRSIA
jgi:hypothetical protein